MKERLKYLAISLGVVAIGAGLMGFGIFSADKEMEKFQEIPVITSEAELETALDGDVQTYCLTNMLVTGEPADDPLGILEGEYGYIMYVKETCELQKDSTYKWSTSQQDGVTYAAAPSLKLFDTYDLVIPEGMTEYNYYIVDYSEMNEDTVKEEYLEKIDGSYYPEGIGDLSGNSRYNVFLAPLDTECAVYANVGEGKVTLALNEDAQNYIIPDGDIEMLFDCHGSSKGMMPTLIGMMIILPLGVMFTFASIIGLIFGGGKKKRKK